MRSHLTNERLGLNLLSLNKNAMHAHKVTQGHADAWDLLKSSRTLLVLEEDFQPIEAEASAFSNDEKRRAQSERVSPCSVATAPSVSSRGAGSTPTSALRGGMIVP